MSEGFTTIFVIFMVVVVTLNFIVSICNNKRN